jgi:Ser/Thr protein kinase RdoA (MazF antagonist)
MSLLEYAPNFSTEQAAKLAEDLYGRSGAARMLPSERDQNFLIATENEKFVLKIANALEQRELLDAQNEVLKHLKSKVSFCPQIVFTTSGESITHVLTGTAPYYVRLVTYIPGEPLAETVQSGELLFDLGRTLGKLSRALSDFDHEAFHRNFHWDLANGLRVITEYDVLLADNIVREPLVYFATEFENTFAQKLARLPRTVIHGDANDYNVVVKDQRVAGLIDFGDMVYSYTVGELAVALAYVVLDKPDPLLTASQVVAGYVSEANLNDDELELLWALTLMRLCMSVCMAAFQRKQKPDNAYLDISQQAIRNALPRLLAINPEKAGNVIKSNL